MNDYFPYVNYPLPYPYDALEPYIDGETMYLHHDKHLQTYVDKLNAVLTKYPALQRYSLTELLAYEGQLPDEAKTELRNNAGGVYNHRMYFEGLTPVRERRSSMAVPFQDSLQKAVTQEFGSRKALERKWKEAALSVFGSGYAWLVWDGNGLRIVTTPNQDTPIPKGLCPVMNIDVWEHAYYLKNFNRRNEYLDKVIPLINWKKAYENYAACMGNAVMDKM